MHIDITSIEGRRPLVNAFQFINPSPEPSPVAASKSPLGNAPQSLAVPARAGDARGLAVISRSLAEGGGAHTGAQEGSVELQRKVSHYLQPILSHQFLNNLA
jgi:hypothetical protein